MEFSNPVLAGMYPDPSVCRVGRDCYLVTSTFEYFPGVPIFHSRDLVRWRQLGHVLTRRSQLDLAGAPSSGGIFAPTLRHHAGTFYVVTTLAGRGNFVVTATHPSGPWGDPVWLDDEGLDPSLAFLDGRIYYTRNGPGSDADHPFIYQTELEWDRPSPGGTEPRLTVVDKPRVIWEGTGGIWPEAPHLYRRATAPRHYFLLTAEGGTSYGHSVVVARSTQPYGPFEAAPLGPLLTHRDAPRHPVQATGHADWVDLEDRSTWAVLLGIRPTAGSHHHLGRETFLAPVTWSADGWPRMGDRGRLPLTLPSPVAQEGSRATQGSKRDDFDSERLDHSWMFVRNPNARDWSTRQRPGHLRLWGSAQSLGDVASPALVCCRQQHFDVVVRTRLDFEPQRGNEHAGLCVRANEAFHYALLVGRGERGRELRLVETQNGRSHMRGSAELGHGPLTLEVTATAQKYTFRGGTGESLRTLGALPTQALAAETITQRTGRHHFTGAMFGLLATGNGQRSTAPADFDWFDYLPGAGP